MADQSYQLVVRKGPRPGQVFPLTLETVTIGRDPMTDIVINDPEVSRHHAKLSRRAGGGYEIQDMGSTNGTFVDGKRLGGEIVQLSPGQAVMVGSNVTMTYQSTSAADPMATMIAPAGMPAPKPVAEAEPPAPAAPAIEPVPVEPLYEAAAIDEPMDLDIESPTSAGMPEFSPPPAFSAPAEPDPLPSFDIAPEPLPSFEPEPLPSFESPGSVKVYDEPAPLPSFSQSSTGRMDSGRDPLPAFDSGPAAPPPPPGKSGPLDGRNRNIVIGVVVFLLLCCCCSLIALIANYWDTIQAQLSLTVPSLVALAGQMFI
jgi:predicted component of type VI protein secretion system